MSILLKQNILRTIMAGLISKTALNPLLTGPLWAILTGKAPEQLTEPVMQYLRQHLSPEVLGRAITSLKWLAIIGVGRWIHNALNVWAMNNFRIKSEQDRYYWPKEVAFVTGAASGFGRLMSLNLASKGVNVVAIDIVDQLPKEMQSVHKITYYKCDVTDRDAVMAVAEQVKSAHGSPSILINNAGIAGKDMDILTVSPQLLDKIFGVNVISHYYTLQAFLPDMIRQKKGHVVTIASMASFISGPGMSPYSATKSAVLAMHEALRAEARVLHKAPEIKFTSVHPTFADTAIIAPYKNDLQSAKMLVLKPEVVSDAVVNQIMSCRGGQIFLPSGYGILASMRGWPHYITQTLLGLSEQSATINAVKNHTGKLTDE